MESSGPVRQLWAMTYQPDVPSRSESTWIAMAAATRGPWKAALAGGVIVGAVTTVLVTRLLPGFSGAFFNALFAGLAVTVLVAMIGYVARAVHR